MAKGSPCSNKAEIEMRVDRISRMLVSGVLACDIKRFAKQEWGTSPKQVDIYIKRAREAIKESLDIDRRDYFADHLATLHNVLQKSLKAQQYNNALGALKQISILTGLEPGGGGR